MTTNRSEAEKRRFANASHELVVRFSRLDYNEAGKATMLIMERIYPIDYRAHEVERRGLWFDVFADKLAQLHTSGFVHRGLKRPSDLDGLAFDNILLTNRGLRLIDAGISAVKHQVGDKIFARYVAHEQEELLLFRDYSLNR
ncbi:hypothetical protein [Fibrella arboris]|uniref:hypothetical protein n=1 Tax=Fibrella arboris TaxID=3242486 RepID=UPI00351FA41D